MKIFHAKDKYWFNKWYEFNQHQTRGNHLQDPIWLSSYESYGFGLDLILSITEDHEIIGGYLAVIAKKGLFKFYIIPQGPIVKFEEESLINDFLIFGYKRSKKIDCTAIQVSIPFTDHSLVNDFTYKNRFRNNIPDDFIRGKVFKYVYTGYGLNWVNLEKFKDFDDYLMSLKSQNRRNIRLSYEKNDKTNITESIEQEKLKDIYSLVELNGEINNYSVRPYNDLETVLKCLLSSKKLICIRTYFNHQIISSGFSVDNDYYISYLFGGTKRMKPDTKAGYSIHFENIKLSFKNKYKGYNISMGGSKGVKNFKSKFGAEEIFFNNPHYHVIHKPFVFKLFSLVNKYLKKYKSTIAKWL